MPDEPAAPFWPRVSRRFLGALGREEHWLVVLYGPFHLDDPIFFVGGGGSLVRRLDRATGSTVNSPILKLCIIRNVCPCFSVEFQGDLQMTSIEKVRR